MSTSAVNLKSAVQQPIIVTHKSLDKQQLIDALNRFDYKDTDEVKVIIPQLNNYFQSIKTHQKCSDYLGAIDILLSELHSNVRVNFYMQFSITNRESSRADKKVEKDSIWVVRLLMQTGFNAQIVTQLETPHTGYNGLGTDEYKYCKKFVTDFNMRIKQVGIIRPREMKSSRVTLINRWTPVTRLQSEPASSTDIVIAASSTNKSSAHPTSSSFPDNVQFEPSQVSGAGQVKCVEGKNCLFTREKEESGNAIALLNATIDTSGTYEFTYIIEKDIGASCCIGLAPESIKDKFSLDAMTHTEDNILFDKTLNSIRSFGG
ncbi:MAG: hypothetical protein HAW66_07695, partial [Shewanella sp.]|nr:hypothetical protein [Shewanella sp.]